MEKKRHIQCIGITNCKILSKHCFLKNIKCNSVAALQPRIDSVTVPSNTPMAVWLHDNPAWRCYSIIQSTIQRNFSKWIDEVCFKLVLNITSQTVHDASWSFEKLGRTLQNILHQQLEASQLLACRDFQEDSSMLLVASDWLVWTSTWHWSKGHWASDQLTTAHFAAWYLYRT